MFRSIPMPGRQVLTASRRRLLCSLSLSGNASVGALPRLDVNRPVNVTLPERGCRMVGGTDLACLLSLRSKVVRKTIARVLTVISHQQRSALRDVYAKKVLLRPARGGHEPMPAQARRLQHHTQKARHCRLVIVRFGIILACICRPRTHTHTSSHEVHLYPPTTSGLHGCTALVCGECCAHVHLDLLLRSVADKSASVSELLAGCQTRHMTCRIVPGLPNL